MHRNERAGRGVCGVVHVCEERRGVKVMISHPHCPMWWWELSLCLFSCPVVAGLVCSLQLDQIVKVSKKSVCIDLIA
jgi:hypothetical protein